MTLEEKTAEKRKRQAAREFVRKFKAVKAGTRNRVKNELRQ